jgi:hypothetical protein
MEFRTARATPKITSNSSRWTIKITEDGWIDDGPFSKPGGGRTSEGGDLRSALIAAYHRFADTGEKTTIGRCAEYQ